MANESPNELWESSPHADAESESFVHWDDEGVIPANCARCHSRTGFLDYQGSDGSDPLVTDREHATGTVVDCQVCHGDLLASIPFPSGAEVDVGGPSASCMVCHQGRASTDTLDNAIGGRDADTVDAELNFVNVHYRAAAATLLGTEARGGYQYPGKDYAGRFSHVPTLSSCAECHNPHSLEVTASDCTTCHQGQAFGNIRMSTTDADGDGDTAEGIAAEIQSVHAHLGEAITQYAATTLKQAIGYDAARYPYFFHDLDADGTINNAEGIYPNRYQSWTPRLLQSAYNYQFVAKDPGAYAHNPRYALQLLIDSIEDLQSATAGANIIELNRPR